MVGALDLRRRRAPAAPERHPEEGGLAGAVAADHGDPLARAERPVDAVEHRRAPNRRSLSRARASRQDTGPCAAHRHRAFAAALAALALLAWAGWGAPGRSEGPRGAARGGAGLPRCTERPHKALAQLPFDDAGRLDWHFIPRERKGLPLGAMSDAEKTAAQALLHAGLSAQGYLKANGVMTLESVLQDGVRASGGDVSFRDPGHYFFTIFGEPRGDAPFLAGRGAPPRAQLHVGAAGGTSPTPLFFGANPACVPADRTRLPAPRRRGGLARALARCIGAARRARRGSPTSRRPRCSSGRAGGRSAGDPASRTATRRGAAKRCCARASSRAASSPTSPATTAPPANAGVAAIRFAWAGGLRAGQGHYWRANGRPSSSSRRHAGRRQPLPRPLARPAERVRGAVAGGAQAGRDGSEGAGAAGEVRRAPTRGAHFRLAMASIRFTCSQKRSSSRFMSTPSKASCTAFSGATCCCRAATRRW